MSVKHCPLVAAQGHCVKAAAATWEINTIMLHRTEDVSTCILKYSFQKSRSADRTIGDVPSPGETICAHLVVALNKNTIKCLD